MTMNSRPNASEQTTDFVVCAGQNQPNINRDLQNIRMFDSSAVELATGIINVTIVIPTLNAGETAEPLLEALQAVCGDLRCVLIIDSQSNDGSVDLFRQAGCAVRSIEREAFDHGGTRNLGVELSQSADVVLFLTQDALPNGADFLRRMMAPFADPDVALVYGRQLARPGAGQIEAHARRFNYPDVSTRRALPGAGALGVKAVFNSNSCAAYRRTALLAVGGFPDRIIMGEDQVAAARLLLAGWTIAYQADACVSHSHPYRMTQEFARYFDIGVFHAQQRTLLARYGTANSEGRRYIVSEFRHLLRTSPARIPEAMLRTGAKLLGYRLGLRHRALPNTANRLLAMNKRFFAQPPIRLSSGAQSGAS